ncbi:SDR family NAD(P)-dependent oxidoreductase [Anaerocolumna sp. AGMB13025]|uniref:SDR family NAD(P)-dependent oxidoreductase n=1 Tax=Anaerocolumna sp. AGMB13025 TaxID=3039116 RepID=UPI00241D7879|nr:SDR family NAD(P)-dependent oxidoreductase [Anaerocolumna sp. AGMB13025]WFR55593.1 SDR family NAD(P)-dependent oxidoreductase [Anaerocolumna sp. AGMB13025]
MSGSNKKEEKALNSVYLAEDNRDSSTGHILNYYEEEWTERVLDKSTIKQIESVLVFGLKEIPVSIDSNLVNKEKIVTVYQGGRYQYLGRNEYEINPHIYEDYVKLLNVLKEEGFSAKHIVYSWTLSSGSLDLEMIQKITNGVTSILDMEASGMTEGTDNLFNLLKSIIQVRMTDLNKILVFTQKKEELPDPFHDIIANFGKSTGFLMPEVAFSTVHIDEIQQINEFINQELSSSYSEPEIFYHKNKRHIKTYKKLPAPSFEKPYIRPGSVFLITGGAGKLGMLFARYLAEEYEVNLVLVGRSELDNKKIEMIEDLETTGSQVLYQKVDVTNKTQMQKVIEETKKRFGELNGVIHAAGLVSDKLISQKEYDEFNRVVQTKMLGTVILDELTKNEPLEYFILFSSTSSIIGDFGQCDYSVGNRFLDCYKDFRQSFRKNGLRSGRTITINWPLWENGGMHQEKETENLYLQTSGLSYLRDDDGLRAFNEILGMDREQVIVFYGNPQKVEKILGISDNLQPKVTGRENNLESRTIFAALPKKADDASLDNDLEYDIRFIAADILKVNVKDIESNLNFGDFGFDSISLKILIKKLGEKFNIELSPTILFSASTIKGLAQYLLDGFFNEINQYYDRSGINRRSKKEIAGSGKEISETIKNKAVNRMQRIKEEIIIKQSIDNEPDLVTTSEKGTQTRKGYLVPLKNHFQEPVTCNSKYNEQELTSYEPVAIIGAEGLFPGSKDLNEFWDNLKEGRDMITEIPSERWDWREYYSEDRLAKNKSMSKCGGFIKDVDKFDASFFNISPMEAELMDPQQRLLLQTIWKVTEDAGYKASELSGKPIGVYIGVQFNDYQELLQESDEMKPQIVTGNSHAVLANRISYYMNFKGPSEAIDTACSGSLVAIHHAVKSIQRGESEMAVAGGVSLMLSPKTFLSASKLGVLSPDNHCKTFDESANGYVRGEGIGVILLKPLKQAIKDRDNIYAVIKGSAQNHGGRANSLTAPNSDSQAAVLAAAYKEAGMDPDSVTYIEAHGTGTELGDPVEIEGLKKAFQELSKDYQVMVREPRCGLGSVKTNIGHLEPAAGIAGIIKVILAMRNHTLPASINFNKLNPYINFENSPFYIVTETREWNQLEDMQGNRIPRRAGVSSFGFGGANAHVVLEEYSMEELPEAIEEDQIIVLSARTEKNLKQYAIDLLDALNSDGKDSLAYPLDQVAVADLEKSVMGNTRGKTYSDTKYNLEHIAFTLQAGREAMNERLAFVVSSTEELRTLLKQFINGEKSNRLISNNIKKTQDSLEILGGDEDADAMVEQWISKRKLNQIAKLWTTGYEINWKLLHNPETVQRISLPTYPFTKESYWLPESSKNSDNNKKELGTLIHATEYLMSFNGEMVFSKDLYPHETIVKDHVINGQNIFPGVGYMEMAYQAASVIFNSKELEISRLFWLSPLIMNKSGLKILISFKKEGEKLLFEVKEDGAGTNSPLCAKGEIHKAEKTGQNQIISLEELKSRCPQVISGEDIYKHYEISGINYGKYFKGIKEIYKNDREVLGIIHIPENSGPDLKTYTLPPALLDSALQTISCIAAADGKINLPFAVERFEILKPLKPVMYSYVKASGNNSYEISLINEAGEVCARFHKYVLKEIRSKSPDCFYEPVWRKSPLLTDSSNEIRGGNLSFNQTAMIIYTKEGEIIADRIADKHVKTVRILLGEETIQKSDDFWEAKYDDPKALGETIKKVKERNLIYFLGGIKLKTLEEDNLLAVKDASEKGVISLFRLIKALEGGKSGKRPVELKVITNNIYPVGNSPVVVPAASGIHGFIKSLAKEYTKYKITTVDIDLLNGNDSLSGENLDSALIPVLNEPHNPNGETVVYREGNRYERKIEALPIPSVTQSVFKEKGVYVILGGAGGIGLILSRYLSKKVKARLFLIGRGGLNESKKNIIKEIESLGGTVHYYQADITDPESMKAAVSEVKALYGDKINGVFHSAMVSADKMIYKMTEEEFKTAFDPKVYGSVVLYSIFQKEALDFMAFFSSTSSQIGMPGQSNYVSGLNFKDTFACYIQDKTSYPVKIFNWGYWGIGSGEQEEFRERMKKIGIQAIEPREGMEIVEWVLKAKESQVFILKAENKVLKQMGITSARNNPGEDAALKLPFQSEKRNTVSVIEGKDISADGKNKSGKHQTVEDQEVTKERIRDYLKTIIAKTLKCDKDSIENRTSFQEYGIDSILGFQIYGDLEESFGDIPTTLFLDNDNIDELVAYFMQNYQDRINGLFHQNISGIDKNTLSMQSSFFRQGDVRRDNVNQNNDWQDNIRQDNIRQDKVSQDNDWQNNVRQGDVSQVNNLQDNVRKGNVSQVNNLQDNVSKDNPASIIEPAKGYKEDTLKRKLIDFLQDTMAEILKCNKDSIESQLSFEEFGIDSILGFQILAALEASFDDLPATLFLDNTNLEELAEYLIQNHSEKTVSMFGEEVSKAESEAATGMNLLTYEETKEPRFSDLIKEKSKDIKLPVDLESFLVEVEDNIKIEVSRKGSGEPVLIIPGLAVTTVISSYQFIELSSKYQVIGINLPGHGRSDGTEDLSFKGISEILIKVLDKLEIRQPLHVVGGSYGGIIAQNIALTYPDRVRTLTLIGSITATKFEGVAQVFSFTEAVSKDFEAVKRNAKSYDVIQNIDYYIEIYKHSQSTNSPVLLKYLELMKVRMTTRDVLEQIKVPTLVIVGAVDTVVETEESKLIHSKVENSKYIEIADGGHFIHLTHHEIVSNAILEFLENYKEQ